MTPAGFPHSDILGSRFVCQLPEAYRRLLRPSSAPGAKASTLCTYKLDHKDHSKMLASTVQFSSNHRPPPDIPAPTSHHHPHNGEQRRPTVRPDRTVPTKATPQRAVPSGPNSVPSRPATNQRLSVPSPQQAAGVLGSHRPNEPASSRCSTREHHPTHDRRGHGPGHQHHPMTGRPAARCSLERR